MFKVSYSTVNIGSGTIDCESFSIEGSWFKMKKAKDPNGVSHDLLLLPSSRINWIGIEDEKNEVRYENNS